MPPYISAITPTFRVSYLQLGPNRKKLVGTTYAPFSVAGQLDPRESLESLESLFIKALQQEFKWCKKLTNEIYKRDSFKSPIRNLLGNRVLALLANTRPQTIDKNLNSIDYWELYPGCFAKAFISLIPYKIPFTDHDHRGGYGIKGFLMGLQKIADGESTGPKPLPEPFKAEIYPCDNSFYGVSNSTKFGG